MPISRPGDFVIEQLREHNFNGQTQQHFEFDFDTRKSSQTTSPKSLTAPGEINQEIDQTLTMVRSCSSPRKSSMLRV